VISAAPAQPHAVVPQLLLVSSARENSSLMATTGKIGQDYHGSPSFRPRFKELYEQNSWATRSAPSLSLTKSTMQHDTTHGHFGRHPTSAMTGKTEPHQRWFKSHATTFASGGISPGLGLKGTYRRDPHTGVWFKDNKERIWNKEIEVKRPSAVPAYRHEAMPMNHCSVQLKTQP